MGNIEVPIGASGQNFGTSTVISDFFGSGAILRFFEFLSSEMSAIVLSKI